VTRYASYWLRQRNARYVAARAGSLLRRYDVSGRRARERALALTRLLGRFGARPTFAVPGSVVLRDPKFFRSLQGQGAELAVHSFDHLDFRGLDEQARRDQLLRAASAFEAAGLPFTGYRCPYMSWDPSMRRALPVDLFTYSSNTTIGWPAAGAAESGSLVESLDAFYQPLPYENTTSTPWWSYGLVEIPAAVPDDLQLHDGMGLGESGLADAWLVMLERSYERGELFAPLFHPESFDRFTNAFERTLDDAVSRPHGVWIARLDEIAAWWSERAEFEISSQPHDDALRIDVHCSDRATVLVRGFGSGVGRPAWDGYQVIDERTILTPDARRPIVGLADGVPDSTAAFLTNQGFQTECGPGADDCSIVLTASTCASLGDSPALLGHIEASDAPLLRFWRWPSGNRSALAFAGDLDALSLIDYAGRLRRRQRQEVHA
jgi:peptidoglycan/xylan/chitin deacetylase (PgdA/CDA1 family)